MISVDATFFDGLEAAHDWERCDETSSGFLPAGRYGHSAALVGSAMVIFGGAGADGRFCEEVCEWSLEALQWRAPNSL